jgi:hypothetical protein
MSRKTDLECHVRESYKLVREYEQILQTSSDPKEKARCSNEIAGQRKLIKGYLKEYVLLVQPGGPPIPADIRQIAATVGVSLPSDAAPAPSTTPPAAAVSEPARPAAQAPTPLAPSPSPLLPVAHALVVGVAAYRHIRPLAKTTADARDLHDLLIRNGYAADHCTLLLDDRATKGAIGDALDGLARRVAADDTVTIFFSGHGAQRIGGFEPGEYLCPVEADWYNLRATAISNEEFTAALRAIRVGRLLVLLDACHAGGVGQPRDVGGEVRAGLSDAAYAQMAVGKGRALIASCRPDESSWELPGMRNGLFTHYLLEGLKGGATGPGQPVRLFDLFRYVSEQVPLRAQQHPLFKGEIQDDYILTISS